MHMQIWLNLAFWIIDILVSELKGQLIDVPFSHISTSPRNTKGSLSLMPPYSMTCSPHNLNALIHFHPKSSQTPCGSIMWKK